MPAIYMTHAEHGATHVYSEEDAARHEKLGWRKSDHAKMIEPEERIITESPAFAFKNGYEPTRLSTPALSDYEELSAQYEAKFGRPPHHRMKVATIKARLRE